MKRSVLATAVLASFGVAAQAATVTVSNDVNVTGVVTSSAIYLANTGGSGHDKVGVTDLSVGIDNGEAKVGGVGYIGVIGMREMETIIDTNGLAGDPGTFAVGMDFGFVTYRPVEPLKIEMGFLLGTIGAEASPSWLNGNMFRGIVWNSQPSAYNGVRLRYNAGSVGLFVEGNYDTSQGTASGLMNYSLGATGGAGPVNYSVTYYDGNDSRNIVDVVISSSMGMMDIGANVDYYMIDEAATGQDDSAFGVALHVKPKMGKIEIPVRLEYVSDGTSGVYGVDSGYSFTITPTLKPSDNSFVRVELAYMAADNKLFSDDDNKPVDTQMKAGLQFGYKF